LLGAAPGSARIDTDFEKSVQERLGMADRVTPLGIDIDDASWHMMKSKEFQNAKCDYGSMDDTDTFSVAIPNLSKQYGVESLGIINGELRYKRYVLIMPRRLFSLIESGRTSKPYLTYRCVAFRLPDSFTDSLTMEDYHTL
jgi:hypothetical protein